jgi:hypothetical protein
MEAVRQVVGALMARRGVTPDVRLTEDAPGALARPAVFQFLIGDARYVGLVPKIALAESKTPTDAFAVALDIGRPAFVYDARKGRFLGQGQTFQIEVSYSDGSFLAALPRPVEGLAVACEPARQGDTARVRVKRLSAGEDLAFAQLCVFRPDKTEAFVLRRVVRVEGNAATTDLPIALNDPPGDWRLEVRDAATGATATGVLSVRPQ